MIRLKFPVGLFRFLGAIWAFTFLVQGSNSPIILGTGFAVLSGLAILCFTYFPVCEDPGEKRALAIAGRSFFISAVLMIVVTGNATLLNSFRPSIPAAWTGLFEGVTLIVVYPLGFASAKVAVDAVADLVLAFLDRNSDSSPEVGDEADISSTVDEKLQRSA